jgi:WhiB family redox-sensing transcriptional regulator
MTPQIFRSFDARRPIMMTWRNRAACLDEEPELFFPIGNTGPAPVQIEEAKGVCGSCEVVETCLEWAVGSGQDVGVWGGLTEDERRDLERVVARDRRAS